MGISSSSSLHGPCQSHPHESAAEVYVWFALQGQLSQAQEDKASAVESLRGQLDEARQRTQDSEAQAATLRAELSAVRNHGTLQRWDIQRVLAIGNAGIVLGWTPICNCHSFFSLFPILQLEGFRKEHERLEVQVSTYRDLKEGLEEDRRRLSMQLDTLTVQVRRHVRKAQTNSLEGGTEGSHVYLSITVVEGC